MTEKGCDNCYYSYFDERAYPCSLCIRGIERTDQWQPSKKTKADRKPQTNKDLKVTYTCSFTDCDNFKNFGFGEKCIECKRKQSEAKYKTEPQTCRNCKWSQTVCRLGDNPPCHSYEPKTEPQTDCSWK